jgi:hypothetical protein
MKTVALSRHMQHLETKSMSDHIQNLVNYIAAEEEEKNIPDSLRSNIDILVKANITHGVNLLKSSTPF